MFCGLYGGALTASCPTPQPISVVFLSGRSGGVLPSIQVMLRKQTCCTVYHQCMYVRISLVVFHSFILQYQPRLLHHSHSPHCDLASLLMICRCPRPSHVTLSYRLPSWRAPLHHVVIPHISLTSNHTLRRGFRRLREEACCCSCCSISRRTNMP